MTADFGYSVRRLDDAAAGHDELHGAIADVAARLPGLSARAGSLGTMDAATGFVAALGGVTGGLGRAAQRAATARAASTTARLGDLLNTDTEAIAAAATPLTGPGTILEQMR